MNIYTYKNCSTCRKATQWLDANDIEYTELAIRETPPTIQELKQVLAAYDGELKRLFNVSGGDYRSMGLKDTLSDMSISEALKLLTTNGNLVKRPFVVLENGGLVGFKVDEWAAIFS